MQGVDRTADRGGIPSPDLRVGVEVVNAGAMTYIVQRQDRFYVVAYDGLDPLTGKERRRWHPVGHDRTEAKAVAERLDPEHCSAPPPIGGPITIGIFLRETWVPQKRRQVRTSTAYRYAWFVERYIIPAIGDVPLRRLRVDHLDDLYQRLGTTGGRRGIGLAPKTVLEVHTIIRAALECAVQRELLARNVAHAAHARLARAGGTTARVWSAAELGIFLTAARSLAAPLPRPPPHRPYRYAPRRGGRAQVVGL